MNKRESIIHIISHSLEISVQDPWVGQVSPAKLVLVESGLSSRSIWGVDEYNDVYYYDGFTWKTMQKKATTLTVAESGVFLIEPRKQYIVMRRNVRYDNPEGDGWVEVSRNRKGIQFLESTNFNVIYGVDKNNVLWYATGLSDFDSNWKVVPNIGEQMLNNNEEDSAVREISCNHFSCWVVSSTGTVYSMKTPWDPSNAKWTRDYGRLINCFICCYEFLSRIASSGWFVWNPIVLV